MTQKLCINKSWTQFRMPLKNLEDFNTHGSLSGRKGPAGYTGQLDSQYTNSARSASYVVYSYSTPIAWFIQGEGWIMPDEKYSVTTSKSQGRIRTAIGSL